MELDSPVLSPTSDAQSDFTPENSPVSSRASSIASSSDGQLLKTARRRQREHFKQNQVPTSSTSQKLHSSSPTVDRKMSHQVNMSADSKSPKTTFLPPASMELTPVKTKQEEVFVRMLQHGPTELMIPKMDSPVLDVSELAYPSSATRTPSNSPTSSKSIIHTPGYQESFIPQRETSSHRRLSSGNVRLKRFPCYPLFLNPNCFVFFCNRKGLRFPCRCSPSSASCFPQEARYVWPPCILPPERHCFLKQSTINTS
jgi:hypothetical protein